MHVLSGDADRLFLPDDPADGLVPKIRPFHAIPEREVALYAYLHVEGFEIGRCPYSHIALRADVRSLLNDYDWRHPSTKYALVNLGGHLASCRGLPEPAASPCPICGEPCRGECRSCQDGTGGAPCLTAGGERSGNSFTHPGERRSRSSSSYLRHQIIAFTSIFHYAYPVLEGKPICWPTALLFVLETVTTVGYGYLLPFANELTILFTIIVMITGILLIFMVIPLLLVPYLRTIFLSAPPKKLPHEFHDHVVIVGYGELTKALLESIRISDLPVLIVVSTPEAARLQHVNPGRRPTSYGGITAILNYG